MGLRSYYKKSIPKTAVGCDEAGRGCLAGPVFAAAVVLPKNFRNALLNDSKKLSKKNRDALRIIIEEKALHWAVAKVMPKEIDKINILQASLKAMHLALDALNFQSDIILVDGNKFEPYGTIAHECVIKGDGKFKCIAAASILAKTHRDAYMEALSQRFPSYGWERNKGYPTLEHRMAVIKEGSTKHHRKTFKVSIQTKLALD